MRKSKLSNYQLNIFFTSTLPQNCIDSSTHHPLTRELSQSYCHTLLNEKSPATDSATRSRLISFENQTANHYGVIVVNISLIALTGLGSLVIDLNPIERYVMFYLLK